MRLLTEASSNAKTSKNLKFEQYLTYILHLAPSNLSGIMNTCPKASKGCRASCLYSAGRGVFRNVQEARIRKTKILSESRAAFLALLRQDLYAVRRKARRLGKRPVVRLNGTSDLDWTDIVLEFSDIQFYDYTKVVGRLTWLPPNYHLTFSRSENNERECRLALTKGINVAVVFDQLPKEYLGRPVISGDEHDLRFLDPSGGYIIGLTPKGRGKKDITGFVVQTKGSEL